MSTARAASCIQLSASTAILVHAVNAVVKSVISTATFEQFIRYYLLL